MAEQKQLVSVSKKVYIIPANQRYWPNAGLMVGQRLQSWSIINPFSSGTGYGRQILTSIVDPRTEKLKHF